MLLTSQPFGIDKETAMRIHVVRDIFHSRLAFRLVSRFIIVGLCLRSINSKTGKRICSISNIFSSPFQLVPRVAVGLRFWIMTIFPIFRVIYPPTNRSPCFSMVVDLPPHTFSHRIFFEREYQPILPRKLGISAVVCLRHTVRCSHVALSMPRVCEPMIMGPFRA